jgi:hypothetical protein
VEKPRSRATYSERYREARLEVKWIKEQLDSVDE